MRPWSRRLASSSRQRPAGIWRGGRRANWGAPTTEGGGNGQREYGGGVDGQRERCNQQMEWPRHEVLRIVRARRRPVTEGECRERRFDVYGNGDEERRGAKDYEPSLHARLTGHAGRYAG